MFEKILIANRGEIACRIIKTARRLGICTVAVYSAADATARHVTLAEEAYLIGPAAARESYLKADVLIEAAKRSGAQAIHPGYGFLSENAAFAEACAAAGLVFVGPPPSAIRAMGSKRAARAIMARAGIPLVPGYHGGEETLEVLRQHAAEIGYPVLIKASAGGGGKGMRIVEHASGFEAALLAARREAAAAFGEACVLLEKYLSRARHIEIQIFADAHGHCVHLFERDCSVQRRHQKVLEEAPAQGLAPPCRDALGKAAIAAAQAIGYVGAGTVEFMVDREGAFYFMEMNTRLQVEHPVTEFITGQDLVEWQLRVAAGEALPCTQEALRIEGHAMEARIYAEDPRRAFLPATGHLTHLRFPSASPHVRVDTGVRQGDAVTLHYDPLIAKLVVWDRDRASARCRLLWALRETQVGGVSTNIEFLARVAAHPAFASGVFDTGFIDRYRDELCAESPPVSDSVLALVCLYVLLNRAREALEAARQAQDPYSPWHLTSGWRLNSDSHQVLRLRTASEELAISVRYRGDGYLIECPSGPLSVSGELCSQGELIANLDGIRQRATVIQEDSLLTIFFRARSTGSSCTAPQ
jgi:Acetyl/propionyl-CoA carboxylase, alpha subunit